MSDSLFTARNLHALPVAVPAQVAAHFNSLSESASSVIPGEHLHFEEVDANYLMLAVPAAPLPKEKFIEEYQKLEVRIDGSRRVRLSRYPRLFSHSLSDGSEIRGVPTLVPLTEFGDDFIGQAHDFELLRDGVKIFGPVRWLVSDARTGPIIALVEGGPGPGEVSFHCRKIDFKLMSAVLYIDAAFGDPVSVQQVLPDGSRRDLSFQPVGIDMVGDQPIFREAYVEGFQAGFSRELQIRLKFDRSGEGYFAAVGQTFTEMAANQIIQVP